MRILAQLIRIALGGIFIFSGWIKANDSLGFAYKLIEYFEVFGTEFFVPYALPLAMLICIIEMLLGVTLLIGAKTKLTLWLLLLMILFSAFLTFYSAYFSKVLPFGCFGIYLKLTPWTYFVKDFILVGLIIILIVGKDQIQPIFGPKLEGTVIVMASIAAIAFPIYTYNFLPVKDYRPYAVGKNIPAQMKGAPDQLKYRYKVKDKKTAEVKIIDKLAKDYELYYELIEPVTEVSKEGTEAEIKDFFISTMKGQDRTDMIENPDYNFLLICYDLDKTNKGAFGKINDFATLCKQDHVKLVALTASTSEQVEQFKREVNTDIEFYESDATVLKTMIRSNPGLMLLKGGTVQDKWHYHSIPAYTDVKQKYFKSKR
jgi:uncharacterized membrane protein YphA (DoxX/SURF4 family)